MSLASLIDTEALLDVALFSLAATIGVVTAFAVGVLAWDRIATDEVTGARRVSWAAVMAATAVVCIGIIAVGLWAMTQK